MDSSLYLIQRYIYHFLIFFGAGVLYFSTSENKATVLSLYAVLALIALLHHWRYRAEGITSYAVKYLLIIELVICLTIQYFDNTPFSGFYIFILLAEAFIYRSMRFVVIYSVCVFLGYVAMAFFKSGTVTLYEFWAKNAIIVLPRTFILILIIVSRNILEVNMKNNQLAKSLQEKNLALEDALDQITAYTGELKKMAELRAREALMDELHDRLGHTLTTVSIVVQAANVLIGTDTAAAKSKLDIVTKQIQGAMLSLRNLISGTSHIDEGELSYTENLLMLIGETQRHTGITINHNINEASSGWLNGLPIYAQSFVYNTLMEGMTNGLRHGAATVFDFSLTAADSKIYFYLHDNGRGFDNLTPGHGLTKMRRDTQRLNARLEISGKAGCTLRMIIPMENIQTGSAKG